VWTTFAFNVDTRRDSRRAAAQQLRQALHGGGVGDDWDETEEAEDRECGGESDDDEVGEVGVSGWMEGA
jgi:hypothetical protein